MKTIFWLKSLSLGLFILLLSACKVVNTEPVDFISDTSAFATPARIEIAMAGVYDAAQTGFYDTGSGGAYGAARGYPFGGASIMIGDARGEDMINTQQFFLIIAANTLDGSAANVNGMWNNLYALINKCNLFKEGVETAIAGSVISAATGNAYIAEALFLRALAHHHLLIHFARPWRHTVGATHLGVVYRTTAITPTTQSVAQAQGRSTVAESYQALETDLAFAIANLPTTRASAALRTGRVTQRAAIALRQRVRLHREDFAGAIADGNTLIGASAFPLYNNTTVGLNTLWDGAWSSNTTIESLFSIEANAQDNPGGNGSPSAFYTIAPGRQILGVSPFLFNQPWWLSTDLRKTTLNVAVSGAGAQARLITKFRDPVNRTDYVPVIRYPEVLLNQAEALVRSTGTVDATAINYLNAIRRRGVGTGLDFVAGDFATSQDLLVAIWRERRIELIGEGFRWPDIHRLGNNVAGSGYDGVPAKATPAQMITTNYLTPPPGLVEAQPAQAYSTKFFVWPIPNYEINNNPTLAGQQNAGW